MEAQTDVCASIYDYGRYNLNRLYLSSSIRAVLLYIKQYLINIKMNVSNAGMNISKAIRSLK